MEKQNKKKYYYSNNKKYYPKKKRLNNVELEEKVTYEKLINKRKSVDEIDENSEIYYTDDKVIRIVTVSIIILAIVFGSLLLFHLI